MPKRINEKTDEEALKAVKAKLPCPRCHRKDCRCGPNAPPDRKEKEKEVEEESAKRNQLDELRASTMTNTRTGQCVGDRCGETSEEKKARYAKWREENKQSNKKYWAKESTMPSFKQFHSNKDIYHT